METRVLIIGGGVTGTGLARDLALRGVECMVVERDDVNAGASGANHGLLHSGARYVLADPTSARECRDESRLLKLLAPSCVEDTGGLFVAVPGDDENYIADFPGLCEKNEIAVRKLTTREALELEPDLAESIIAAYRVDDASVNPFKLALDTMAHAKALGARLLTHTEVIGMERSGEKIAAVHLRRRQDGSEIVVNTEQVVNATGSWAGKVASLAGITVPLVCSKGSVLVTQQRIADHVINRLRPPSDGDILVPGGSISLFGTTSEHMKDMTSAVETTFGEVDFLVSEAAKMLPSMAETRYVRVFAGVRPLDGSKKKGETDRALSRSYVILDHEQDRLSNFISIFGGKLTTFRLMAEKAADLVCRRLGVTEPCITRTEPLPASDESKWVEPREELRNWLKKHEPDDTLLCECEMVPQSAIDQIVDQLAGDGSKVDFSGISLRSRAAKGSCQGAFCTFRICGRLYQRGIFKSEEGMTELREFLEKRWKGLRPVLWGRQLAQEQLQEAIYCGLFGLEL